MSLQNKFKTIWSQRISQSFILRKNQTILTIIIRDFGYYSRLIDFQFTNAYDHSKQTRLCHHSRSDENKWFLLPSSLEWVHIWLRQIFKYKASFLIETLPVKLSKGLNEIANEFLSAKDFLQK